MKQISEIYRISRFASRQLGVQTLIFIVCIPAICALLIGCLEFLITGTLPWEIAGGIISDAAIASTAMPSAIGVAGLLMLAVILPAVTGFGYWCLSKATERPLSFWLLPSLVRRPLVLTQSLWTTHYSATCLCLVGVGRPLLLFASRRTIAPTPAALAGAAPLLI